VLWQLPGLYYVNCSSHLNSHNINMMSGLFQADENWGANLKRNFVKTQS
jgi:hypothetical protein